MPVISLRGVGKSYRVASGKERLKELLSLGKIKKSEDFWALEDVSFDVEPGTTLGILGRNGAGKSTLLSIISGIVQPTTGTVEVNGRLAALFGVGSGFNPEFTGRDNAMLNGLLLGIERDEMLERFEEIEAFADIGKFMDQPVKTYSSGMRSRLGFAVAVNVKPDVLILDEVLSVGDAVFKQMGVQKMRELRDTGTTILFVSHSLGMVKSFCDKAILIHKGKLITSGETSEALDRYQALLSSVKAEKNIRSSGEEDRQTEYMIEHEEEEDVQGTPGFSENPDLARRRFRHGTGEARIQNVEILDEQRRPIEVAEVNSRIVVRVHAQYTKDVEDSSLSIILRNKTGLDVFSTGTNSENAPIRSKKEDEQMVVDFTFPLPLKPGDYSVAAYISPPEKDLFLDWIDVAAVFRIDRPEKGRGVRGMIHLPTEVEIHDQDRTRSGRSA